MKLTCKRSQYIQGKNIMSNVGYEPSCRELLVCILLCGRKHTESLLMVIEKYIYQNINCIKRKRKENGMFSKMYT